MSQPASAPPISELGPDALLEPIAKDELFKSLSKKKIGIKGLLLDQSYISGIGNWIADEVLYQARIHPLQIASSISKESSEVLHDCIKEVIEKAIEVGADSSEFPSNWIFHSRENKPGKAFVDGKKIEFIKAGSRTAAYVPELQKLSGAQAVQTAKALAKPLEGASKKTKDEDGDEPGSEDEENAKKVEVKSRKKTAKTRANKPPAKKSDDSDEKSAKADDNDDDTDNGDEELTEGGKKTIARTKSRESKKVDGNHKGAKGGKRPTKRKTVDSDDGSDGDDNEDDEDQKKVTKRKQSNAEKIPKKKIQAVQTGKKPKKRAK